MRRETPPARGLFGISTRKRPARLMKVVSAAPLVPRSSFSTWTMQFLALGEQFADVHAAALRLLAEVVPGDFLQRQEAVALRAVVDEAGLERGLDARDPAFIDVGFFLFPGRYLDTQVKEFLSINQSDPQLFLLSCIH